MNKPATIFVAGLIAVFFIGGMSAAFGIIGLDKLGGLIAVAILVAIACRNQKAS